MADMDDFTDDMTGGELADEYMESSDKLTFDDMVSFTMFTEVMLVALCILIFSINFIFSR